MYRNRGRKIDTWNIPVDGVKHEVPVYMQSKDRGGTMFAVYLHAPDETLKDASIDSLREKTTKAMQARKSLDWERFIYVTFSGFDEQPHSFDAAAALGKTDNGLEGSFTASSRLKYEIVDVCTLANGEQSHRMLNRSHYGRATYPGLPETGTRESGFSDEGKETSALIPFTIENMTALQSIRDRFILLNKQLMVLMAPEAIKKTLETVATNGLLALPAPEKKAKKAAK